MEKSDLIILTGPTAVGKTRLSINLAKKIGGEIISADSMQVYRHMDIGSAKVSVEETEGIPHHLIDIIEPNEEFNVVLFKEKCRKAITEIYERNRIPIIVGGTGFYIQSVLYDINFTQNEEDRSYRNELQKLYEQKGEDYLYEMLKMVDPKSCEAIHKNNVKRVIRALEFYKQTGTLISLHNEEERKKESAYNACYFVLSDERKILYENIEKRVDQMIAAGLVEEVKHLVALGCTRDMVSMQGLGYKEIIDYLNQQTSLSDAIDKIKLETRHFAKRQITWFKREKDVIWINKPDFNYNDYKILEFMIEKLQNRNIGFYI